MLIFPRVVCLFISIYLAFQARAIYETKLIVELYLEMLLSLIVIDM